MSKSKLRIHSLEDIETLVDRFSLMAMPISKNDPTSPWLTVPDSILPIISRLLGSSYYQAHSGASTLGLSAVYWVNLIKRLSDGNVMIRNLVEYARIKVAEVSAVIETDLLYPLLRGCDVVRWRASPSAWIILPQNREIPSKSYSCDQMQNKYPKTYEYLNLFAESLRNRAGYRKILVKRDDDSFYGLLGVGHYTFAEWKVVWTHIGKMLAAVVGPKDGKPVVPQDTITLVACDSPEEAHYLAAMINSSLFQYTASCFAQDGGMSFGIPYVLEQINVPRFNLNNPFHSDLSKLSMNAHMIVEEGRNNDCRKKLEQIERDIDYLSAQVWNISIDELSKIQNVAKQMGGR